MIGRRVGVGLGFPTFILVVGTSMKTRHNHNYNNPAYKTDTTLEDACKTSLSGPITSLYNP